ncbi:hypothetical protein [Woeseia oceani]|nr:hypothetical protein [Woeseia oceani]
MRADQTNAEAIAEQSAAGQLSAGGPCLADITHAGNDAGTRLYLHV